LFGEWGERDLGVTNNLLVDIRLCSTCTLCNQRWNLETKAIKQVSFVSDFLVRYDMANSLVCSTFYAKLRYSSNCCTIHGNEERTFGN